MMADNSEKIQQYCFLFNLVNPQREKFHVDGKIQHVKRNQTNIQKGEKNLCLLETTKTPNFQAKNNKCRTINSGKQGPSSLRPMSS